MDFIEKLFGFAPDNGSGSLEFLLFMTPLAVLSVLYALRSIRRKLRGNL
jgi:hypothetical protein